MKDFNILKNSRRINAVAIFQLVSYIKDKHLFAKYFIAFVKYTYPEVIYAIETGNKPTGNEKIAGSTFFNLENRMINFSFSNWKMLWCQRQWT